MAAMCTRSVPQYALELLADCCSARTILEQNSYLVRADPAFRLSFAAHGQQDDDAEEVLLENAAIEPKPVGEVRSQVEPLGPEAEPRRRC
ncbi:hypothetical protein SCE1572_31145 [Sorangium cellulosum So0157-2]|uniref:Uncharacterized protein n=1 Tax=Sorangium cellulosum So0157-2 TaxID=1254432 RepID=S4XZA4_SORCE|nr:hypothetical protein SCE1572_31145 [Sorangium cellulosum So0157-2]